MIKLFASHPAYKQLIFLPNPDFGDITRLGSTVLLKRSMDGSAVVTHVVKRPDSRTLEMTFELTRLKSLEFLEFFKKHGSELMKLVRDYWQDDQEDLIGYLKVNPLELEKAQRMLVANSVERVNVQIEFETVTETEPENDGVFRLFDVYSPGFATFTWTNVPNNTVTLTMSVSWDIGEEHDIDLDDIEFFYSSFVNNKDYYFTLVATLDDDSQVVTNEIHIDTGGI